MADRVGAVIVAAGAGLRFGGDKIFVRLGDRPLLAHTVDVFERSTLVGAIVIVLSTENVERGEEIARQDGWRKIVAIRAGGRRRQDSVRIGLEALPQCEWVIVHDGARPFVTQGMIATGLGEARVTGAAIAAVPAKDTVKVVTPDGTIEATLKRDRVWLAQTPQVFRRDLLERAHASGHEDVTDDAALLERLGVRVRVFEGAERNLKITTPADLALAECMLAG